MFDISNKCHECFDFIEKEYFNTSHRNENCYCKDDLFTQWSRHESSSHNLFNEVLSSLVYRRTSMDTIGHMDVWYISQYLTKLFKIIEN